MLKLFGPVFFCRLMRRIPGMAAIPASAEAGKDFLRRPTLPRRPARRWRHDSPDHRFAPASVPRAPAPLPDSAPFAECRYPTPAAGSSKVYDSRIVPEPVPGQSWVLPVQRFQQGQQRIIHRKNNARAPRLGQRRIAVELNCVSQTRPQHSKKNFGLDVFCPSPQGLIVSYARPRFRQMPYALQIVAIPF